MQMEIKSDILIICWFRTKNTDIKIIGKETYQVIWWLGNLNYRIIFGMVHGISYWNSRNMQHMWSITNDVKKVYLMNANK